MTKSYHIHTFGCQMNVADSGHVGAELEALGYRPVDQADAADVIVVNTCVVRQSAEEKAIGKLGALAPLKRQRPDLVIGLMGCMVGVKPSPALAGRFPWVDVFMPPSEPGPLVGYLLEQETAREARSVEEAEVLATPEASGNMAYTRFVLERGQAGDYLDLLTALAPCVVGYAEIGRRLLEDPATKRQGKSHPPG